MVIPAHCFPASKTPTSDSDAEAHCGPLAMLGRRRGRRELSEMTGHPEKIVSGGGDSPQAASSRPVESGNRCEKSRVLAILFGRPVKIDSSSWAASMPGSQASTCGFDSPPSARCNEGNPNDKDRSTSLERRVSSVTIMSRNVSRSYRVPSPQWWR